MKTKITIFLLILITFGLLTPKESCAQNHWWEDWPKNMFNPVIESGANTWFQHTKVGTVIQEDGIFKMWYTGFGSDGVRRVGYATSTNSVTWNIYDDPIFSGTVLGKHIYVHSVLRIDDTLRMYYSGLDALIPFISRIGYAWSLDGIDWNEHSEAVLEPGPAGSWDYGSIFSPSVIYDGDAYHMYYNSFVGGPQGIGYATSPDGINWTKDTLNNPIHWPTPNTFYSGGVMASGTHLNNDTVHMWFTGRELNPIRDRIGYGYSTNFHSFTWYEDTALNMGPMTWDAEGVQAPDILMVDGKYKMYYTGNGSYGFCIGVAEGPFSHCVPVYFYGCENGDGFEDFILGNIQNTGSGCANSNGTGWSNYHDQVTQLHAGVTYNLTISSNNDDQYTTIWVDWDQNGEYETEEIVVDNFIMEEAGVSYDIDFVVPQNIQDGTRYLRARTNFNDSCNDPCANTYFGETEEYMIDVITGVKELEEDKFSLHPNPSSGKITLRYSIFDTRYSIFELYSIEGMKVMTLLDQVQQAGEHDMTFDISDLPAGMYFVRMQIGKQVETVKLILMK